MMKNKKKQYLLLVLAVFVWALIVYKLFFTKTEGAGFINQSDKKTVVKQQEDFSGEEPVLNLNYDDPFLKTPPKNHSRKISSQKASKTQPVQKKVSWPKIKYSGMIQNTVNKKVMANLIINNKYYIMTENQTERDVRLIKVHHDSVIISKNNTLKTILKQN